MNLREELKPTYEHYAQHLLESFVDSNQKVHIDFTGGRIFGALMFSKVFKDMGEGDHDLTLLVYSIIDVLNMYIEQTLVWSVGQDGRMTPSIDTSSPFKIGNAYWAIYDPNTVLNSIHTFLRKYCEPTRTDDHPDN
jgi:hypothetical protein